MKNLFLLISFTLSLSLHLVFYFTFVNMQEQPRHQRRPSSRLVTVFSKPKPKIEPINPEIKKKPPKKVKKPPEKPKKKTPVPAKVKKKPKPKPAKTVKKPPPPPAKPQQEKVDPIPPESLTEKTAIDTPAETIPHMRAPAENPPAATPPKAVFGVTPDSVKPGSGSGFSVRVGNTLLKKQEEAFTPQENVEALTTDPAWEAGPIVPVYELSTMALFKKRVQPEYPEFLREEEIEGDVHLTVVVNKYGNVVDIKVKSSDHDLLSAAAIEAMKQFSFSPATVNGVPVTTTIDDVPFIFILDD